MKRRTLIASIALSALAGCASASPKTVAPTGQPSEARTTYEVSFDLEYGYVFERAGDRFFPEIANSELPKFDGFFRDENLRSTFGKRIYCDCEVTLDANGARRRVERATLYAR